MGGEGHVLKRIPRIKFPQRNLNSSSSRGEKGRNSDVASASAPAPAPPQKNTGDGGVGGKASLQPKRTPVSDKEIEAVLLGGCF